MAIHQPYSLGMSELPSASIERAKVSRLLHEQGMVQLSHKDTLLNSPLYAYLSHGLAYTVGSAIGSIPPNTDTCLEAFLAPNTVGLTAGARSWTKHSHRSFPISLEEGQAEARQRKASIGWWGTPSGPVAVINENALAIFWKVMNSSTWRNLHWLPHQILVYEVRVAEGYGLRWSQEQSDSISNGLRYDHPWMFRGFVEPMMENGHQLGWRHPIDPILSPMS